MAESVGPAPAAPSESGINRRCVACGRAIDWVACYCPYCGHDYRCPLGPGRKKEPSSTLKIGGCFTMLSGLLTFAQLGLAFLRFDIFDIFYHSDVGICLLLGIPLAALAVIGGWFALNGKHLVFAIVGSVCGMITMGLSLTTIFALVGLILIIICRDEFKS